MPATKDAKPPPYTPSPSLSIASPNYPPNANYGFNPNNSVTLPLPPGFQSFPVQNSPGPVPSYGATSIIVTHPNDIIIVGGCPACRVGMLEDDFTCLGIFCAIALFPLGILCCLALKNKRCTNCGAYFG